MQVDIIECLPDQAKRSRRNSLFNDVVALLKERPHEIARVSHPDPDKFRKSYKSAIQYRRRHPELNLKLRKQGDLFYVWLAEPEESMPRATVQGRRQLAAYALEIGTCRTVSLAPVEVDMPDDWIKTVSCRVLVNDDDTGEPEEVGTAMGAHVNGTVTGGTGLRMRTVLDEHRADLLEVYDHLVAAGFEVDDTDELLVMSHVNIQPEHRLPGTGLAIFEQLIRTSSRSLGWAVAYRDCLEGGATSGSLPALPPRMSRIKGTDLIVWRGETKPE
jgi:hypothetical protein